MVYYSEETKKKLAKERLAALTPEKLAYSNFLSYIALKQPDYKFAKHNILIAKYLMKVESGEITRLLIWAPPRSGKSMMVGELFPSWYIGRNPKNFIIYATYSFDRAGDVGRKVRDHFVDTLYYRIFPHSAADPDTKAANKLITKQGGIYYALGALGGITGRGAHCLPAGVKIITESGKRDISDIFLDIKSGKKIKVLSCKHEDNKVEFKEVIAGQISYSDDLYEIETTNGRKIKATGNHEFYTTDGYIPAVHLQKNQKIYIVPKYTLHSMQKETIKKKQKSSLLELLQQNSKNRSLSKLFSLWKTIHTSKMRIYKINSKRTHRSLLFTRMFDKTSFIQKSKKMRDVWDSVQEKNNEILFKKMYAIKKNIKTNFLFNLQKRIQYAFKKTKILFSGLQKSSSFNPYDWKRKFSFQNWNKLFFMVPINETSNYGTRSNDVFMLYETNKSFDTPYQPRSDKQQSRKFNSSLFNLPCNSSQIEYDTISVVRKICDKNVAVYDLQVKDNSNFFANEILVHNCLILDDLIKSREEAESENSRRKLEDWFKSVAYTRLMPGKSSIVFISTRWHYNDLAGWLIDNEKESGQKWTILSLPAICDSENDVLGRQVGEALWPDAYPIEKLEEIKQQIGTREWNAQYQQQPLTDESGMVNLNWFKRYEYLKWLPIEMAYKSGAQTYPTMPFEIDNFVISWDTAFKEKELNDPSAATVWGCSKTDVFLVDVINKRMGYPELKQATVRLYEKFHRFGKPVRVLIEDRASGQSLLQDIKMTTRIPVVAISPDANKQIRMDAASPMIEAGRVWLPDRCSWLVNYETQIARFPLWKEDDLVDSTSQFLRWYSAPRYKANPKLKFWK